VKSDGCPETLDLERGLTTTVEDAAALKRLRADAKRMDLPAYLEFLAQFPGASEEELRARKGPRGVPFSLH
jgi:hypothetical protein